jgi:hypothetical protein
MAYLNATGKIGFFTKKKGKKVWNEEKRQKRGVQVGFRREMRKKG